MRSEFEDGLRDTALLERRWVQWALIFAGLSFVALYYTTQNGAHSISDNFEFNWWLVLRAELAYCYLWVPFIPVIAFVDRRYPLVRGTWLPGVLAHLSSSIILSCLHQIVFIAAVPLIGLHAPGPFWQSLSRLLIGNFHLNMTFYWGILGVRYVLKSYRKHQERESLLVQAQLRNLKAQLRPHFLFNTLHAILVLMSKDVEGARRMLVQLSDLLRMTLQTDSEQEIPLRQELQLVERYLEIEQTRFQDRLTVSVDVDPKVMDAAVPNLILQPLVENAIRHGVEPRSAAGVIHIRASLESGWVKLQVEDNGPGIADGVQISEQRGIGIHNTQARLEQLYGSQQRFAVQNVKHGEGLRVEVTFPYRNAMKKAG